MMGTQHWIDFYQRFAAFAAMAREYGFYREEVNNMEKSFWEICPLPLTYRENYKKKVKTNVSDF